MYDWINEHTLQVLRNGYIPNCETKQDVITRLNKIIIYAEHILKLKLPTIRKGVEKGWVSFSSPIWANFGISRGLPASCNGVTVEDNIFSIIDNMQSLAYMSALGAGTACDMSKIRPIGSPVSSGGIASGVISYLHMYESVINTITQSNVRRGSCAVWLDINHAEIEDFIDMKLEINGGGAGIFHLAHGVSIDDEWMNEMLAESKGGVKRKLFTKIIKSRIATGYPYIFFKDTANKDNYFLDPKTREKKIINFSNLCTEIMIPDNFTCCLSSVNLLYFDEWKNEPLIKEMTYFLNAVLEDYVRKGKDIPALKNVVDNSILYRTIGIGVLGYHSYLQSKGIAFEESHEQSEEIFKYIRKEAEQTSFIMHGVYENMKKESGEYISNLTFERREKQFNTVLIAVAPTTTSSIILGQVSPSIEPFEANIFENNNAKGSFIYENIYLIKLLKSKNMWNEEIRKSIIEHNGSVQHLECLTDDEKKIFKTFEEMDMNTLIELAGIRQKYIDQGQSLNVKTPITDIKYNAELIINAWKRGLKSLYYHKGVNNAQKLNCKSCEA